MDFDGISLFIFVLKLYCLVVYGLSEARGKKIYERPIEISKL